MTDQAKLLIKAPIGTSQHFIFDFIHNNKEKLEQIKKNIKKIDYTPGKFFLFMGEEYKLCYAPNIPPTIKEKKIFVNCIDNECIKKTMVLLYKNKAKNYLTKRADLIAKKLNFKYNKIKISSAKTRWGSCSSKGNINLTWRLIMTPSFVIDYVIIHELVHLKKPHHKKSFWDMVKLFMPAYEDAKKWLKKNGNNIMNHF